MFDDADGYQVCEWLSPWVRVGIPRGQLIQPDLERVGDAPQNEHRRVALPALGLPEVGHREPGGGGKVLQRQVAGRPPLTDGSTELSQAFAICRVGSLRHPANLAPRRSEGQ